MKTKQYDSVLKMVRATIDDPKFAAEFEQMLKDNEPKKLQQIIDCFSGIVRDQNKEIARLREIITSLAIRSESTCVCEELREAEEEFRIAPGDKP